MKYIERGTILLFTFIGVLALCQAIDALFNANGWKPLSASDWAAWVGAIGTVGAFIGTIWIALESERKNQRAQMDLARVTAADFKSILPDVISSIRFVHSKLDAYFSEGIDGDELEACAKILQSIPRWDPAKLATLVCLPDHVAAKLALASVAIAKGADNLNLVCADRETCLLGSPESIVQEVFNAIKRIDGYLKDAIKQCDLLFEWDIDWTKLHATIHS